MKTKHFFSFLRNLAVVIVATFFVVSAIYATTTIGDNIDTGGTLTVDTTSTLTGNVTAGGTLGVTGLSTFTTVTSTSATTTDYLYIGPDGTENHFDFSGGDLYVKDDAEIDGDLFVTGNTTTTGDLFVGGGTIDLTTATATTTPGIFSRDHTNSTSTVSIGDEGIKGCLELIRSDGTYGHIYLNGTTIVAEAGRCN